MLPDGLPGEIEFAYLLPPTIGASSGPSAGPAAGPSAVEGAGPDAVYRTERVRSVHDWTDDWHAFLVDLEAQFARHPHLRKVDGRDRVILVAVATNDLPRARRGLRELGRLAETAGLVVVDSGPAAPQGAGRAHGDRTGQAPGAESSGSMHLGAEALIFDRELSPSQLRNIATTTDMGVLDRTQLILDIFAQHAKTREGKLQVELAQLRYRAPRLAIMPTAMSRLTGGIGGRGPGETKLEINRRRAAERLTRLERELKSQAKNRATRRRRRGRSQIPVVSIVGYTNAGKSTLLNRMTRAEVVAADKLFATLDTTTRRLRFPDESARSSSPTPSASSRTCPPPSSRPSSPRSRSSRRPICSCTSSTRPTPTWPTTSRPSTSSSTSWGCRRPRSSSCGTRPTPPSPRSSQPSSTPTAAPR